MRQVNKTVYPAHCIKSHVDQEKYVQDYDGPWGDGPSRWNYWHDGVEWVGVTTHERHGAGYQTCFGAHHPLTGRTIEQDEEA